MKFSSWKEDFQGRLDSSGISSMKVSDEEGCDFSKHAGECEDEKSWVTWMTIE